MENTDQYKKVEKLSLPIIESYHKDLLVYDRDNINEFSHLQFLHFTGKTGTYLFLQDSKPSTKLSHFVNWRDDLILYFDGEDVHQITLEKAEEIIIQWEKGEIQWK